MGETLEMIVGDWYWTESGHRAVVADERDGQYFGSISGVGAHRWSKHGSGNILNYSLAEHIGPTMPPTIERPKPETKYVPYTWEDREQIRGKWVLRGSTECAVTGVTPGRVGLNGVWHTFHEAFRDWTHLDGTPFGKRVDS